MIIALDAMGGDFAPDAAVQGAITAVTAHDDLDAVLVGDESAVRAVLASRKYPEGRISVVHASEVITMDDQPSSVLRRKKDASLRRAVELVRDGKADGAVSAGNSGAMMALAALLLGRSQNVQRPAIATEMPSFKNKFLLLDAGANVDCDAENLLQFSLMGEAYWRLLHGVPRPRVAVLSIGEEPSKGNELTKETFKMLEQTRLNFTGNIESKDAFLGEADVVVCDGFTGNIFLKTSEGLVDVVTRMLRREIKKTISGRIGFLFMLPALRNLKKETDYDEYGGAPLLGINGTCFISHGRSTPKAIMNAMRKAADFARAKVHVAIAQEIEDHYSRKEKTVAAG
jgi:glycerol-3-phosphate acyltransferase PlsX